MLGKMLSIVLTGAALLSGSKNAALPEKDIDGTIFLVNRQHVISEQYVPEPLRKTQVHGMSQSMREDAAAALEELFQAAQSEGVKLSSVSGYRSYSKQSLIYSRKVGRTGSEAEADKLVARPGASEHQLGLAMDSGHPQQLDPVRKIRLHSRRPMGVRQLPAVRVHRPLSEGLRGRDRLQLRAVAHPLCGPGVRRGHRRLRPSL